MFVHLKRRMYWRALLSIIIFFISVVGYGEDLKDIEDLNSRVSARAQGFRTYRGDGGYYTEYTLKILNLGYDPIYPPIRMVIDSISTVDAVVVSYDGELDGKPYLEFDEDDLSGGVFDPGEEINDVVLTLKSSQGIKLTYTPVFYGRMLRQGSAFAPLGVKVMGDLSDDIQLNSLGMTLNRARGGVEYRVELENISDEKIYGPIRLFIESSVPGVSLGNTYGEVNGSDYVIVEEELVDGVINPSEASGEIKIFFNNNSRRQIVYTSSVHGFKEYYYDLKNKCHFDIEEVLTELGVSRYRLSLKNITQNIIEGHVRLKINSVSLGGVEYQGDVVDLLQSENGVIQQVPFQTVLGDSSFLSVDGVSSVDIVCGNPDELDLTFDFQVEALFKEATRPSDITVNVDNIQNEPSNDSTVYTISILNNSPHVLVSPIMLVVDSISGDNDGSISIENLSGYINGKPFIEVELPNSMLKNGETVGSINISFKNSQQISFTPVLGVEGSVFVDDTTPPITSHDYASDGIWITTDTTINFSATDASGVKETRYKINSFPAELGNTVSINSEGTYYLSFWSIDNIGNEETPHNEIIVKIDKTHPNTSDDYPFDGIWAKDDAVINLSASDPLSGVRDTKYQIDDGLEQVGNVITINEEGIFTLKYWSDDFAGIVEMPKHVIIVKLDKTPPVTTLLVNGEVITGNLVVDSAVSLELSATDNLSGLAQIQYEINNDGNVIYSTNISLSDVGEYSVSYWSSDNVGNQEAKKQVVVTISTPVAPNIYIANPTNGFRTNDPVVDISGDISDSQATVSGQDLRDGSVVQGVVSDGQFTVSSLPLLEGEVYYTIEAESPNGLKSSAYVRIIRDTTPPQIEITSPDLNAGVATTTVDIIGKVLEQNATLFLERTDGDQEINFDNEGNFIIDDYPLDEGVNEVTLYAVDDLANSGKDNDTYQKVLQITSDTIAPTLDLQVALYKDNDGNGYIPGDPIDVTEENLLLYNQISIVDITGLVEESDVVVKVNGVEVNIDNDGDFSLNMINLNLDEAEEGIIIVSVSDTLLNLNSFKIHLIKDTTGPELFVTSFDDGDVISDPSPFTVEGIVRDARSLTVAGVSVDIVNERFTFNDWSLQEGENLLNIIACDNIGNETELSMVLSLDLTPPDVVSISVPLEFPHYTKGNKVLLSGLAENDSSVAITGCALDVVVNVGIGGFFTQNVFLNNGVTNNITLVQTDRAGNRGDQLVIPVVQDNILPQIQLLSPVEHQLDSGELYLSARITDDTILQDDLSVRLIDNNGIALHDSFVQIVDGMVNSMITIDNDGDYVLSVKAEDKAGNQAENQFVINYVQVAEDTQSPEILVLSIENGDYLNDPNVNVEGKCRDTNGVAEFKISVNDGVYQDVSILDNEGSFNHALVLDNDGSYVIKLRAVDGSVSANVSQVEISINLDTLSPVTKPTVSGITPALELENDAGFLTKSDVVQIMGSYEPGYTVRGESSQETVDAVANDIGMYSFPIHILANAQQNIENIIELIGIDLAGNLSITGNPDGKTSILITSDGIDPQVLNILPADSETNVPLDSKITVYFSEPIQIGSLSNNLGNRIFVDDVEGNKYQGILVEVANDRVFNLVLSENNAYPDCTQLKINVLSGIKDLAGNVLKNNFVSHFTTFDGIAPNAPLVTDVLPGYLINSLNVHIKGTAEAGANLKVYRGQVEQTVVMIGAGGSFDVDVVLEANSLNEFFLIAEDISMNQSDSSEIISIVHDGVSPQLLSVRPELLPDNDDYFVLKNSVFEIEFNESIDPDSLADGITIKGKGGLEIIGVLALFPNENDTTDVLIRFTPDALLPDGEIVTITLTDHITDMAGNGIDLSNDGGALILTYLIEDNEPPLVPVIGSVSEQSPTVSLTVNIDGTAEVGSVVIVNGGEIPEEGIEADVDNDSGAFIVTVPLKGNTNNIITLKSKDRAGNFSIPVTAVLFSDQRAPVINSMTPSPNTDLDTSGLFTVIFSEPIEYNSISGSVLLMQGVTEVPSGININETGNIITLKSDSNLNTNLSHTLLIKTGLTDLAGNSFAEQQEFVYLANDKIVPEKPTILSVSETSPTSAGEITVTGIGVYDASMKIRVLRKNVIISEVNVDGMGQFTITFSLEHNRLNQLDIVAVRLSGNTSDPAILEIYHDDSQPVIDILAPKVGVVLPTDSITMVALIEDASEISSCLVNGVEKILNIDANGYLTTKLTGVTDGQQINIEAEDVVGNLGTASVVLSVSIENPDNDTTGPVISIINPSDGDHIDGETVNLFGVVEDANEISMITVNGEQVTRPSVFPSASSLFGMDLKLVDGLNLITVRAWDNDNNVSEKSITVDVDIAPPSLNITGPDNMAVFIESNVTVTGQVTDSNGLVGLEMDGSTISYDNDGYFSVMLDLDEGKNILVFKATDVADNSLTKELILFYDVIGPEIVLMYPEDNQTGLTFNTPVYAKFSERVNPETVSFNTVKLFYIDEAGDEAKEMTGNVILDGETVSFYPNNLLEPGFTYRFKILNGIKDLVGFDLQASMQTTFVVDTKITSVVGLVVDPKTGRGIHNATVKIVGTDIISKTDYMGNFYMEEQSIPPGKQIFFIDGTTALSDENIDYTQVLKSTFLLINQSNSINEIFYLPHLAKDSTEYINGTTDQIVTFNDTIIGSQENTRISGRFKMVVPAGSLVFPNSSGSGALTAQEVHEAFLPSPEIQGIKKTPLSAVWFHPFGVKCTEPVHIELPIPTDRGGETAPPGDIYGIISYDSATCEWVEVGLGHVSDDSASLVLEDGKGLSELTIVAIVPIRLGNASETGFCPKKIGVGGGESDFFSIMDVMARSGLNLYSLIWWRVQTHKYGDAERRIFPNVAVQFSTKSGYKRSFYNGRVGDFITFTPGQALQAVFVTVLPTINMEWLSTRYKGGRYRKFPIGGLIATHVPIGNSTQTSPYPIYVDTYNFHGNLRFIGDSGLPITANEALPKGADNDGEEFPTVFIYSDAIQHVRPSGLVDGSPVRSFPARYPPYESGGNWYKSYDGLAYGSNLWTGGNIHEQGQRVKNIDGKEGGTGTESEYYYNWWSYIRSGGDLRLVSKMGQYVGEVYTKAAIPEVNDALGIINKIDTYTNITLGKLNIDVYASRKYERIQEDGTSQIVSQILPYNGIASVSDTSVSIHTGMAMANGDKTPAGNYVLYGKISGTDINKDGEEVETLNKKFDIKVNMDVPCYQSLPKGKYKIQVASKSDFKDNDTLYINLKSKDSSASSESPALNPPPARTRPSRGRRSSRGSYIAPRSSSRSARRRTPAPPVGLDRKDYVFHVVPKLMSKQYSTVTYVDWSTWHANADPNHIPTPDVPEKLYSRLKNGKPLVIVDSNSKVPTEINLFIYSSENKDAELVVKITQTGTPYLLGKGFEPGVFPIVRSVGKLNISGDPKKVSDATGITVPGVIPLKYFIDCKFDAKKTGNRPAGKNIKITIIPPISSLKDSEGNPPTGNETFIIQYLEYIEAHLLNSFSDRYWVVEIIDKQTMRPTEVYHSSYGTDFDIRDSVYNQVERTIIYIK